MSTADLLEIEPLELKFPCMHTHFFINLDLSSFVPFCTSLDLPLVSCDSIPPLSFHLPCFLWQWNRRSWYRVLSIYQTRSTIMLHSRCDFCRIFIMWYLSSFRWEMYRKVESFKDFVSRKYASWLFVDFPPFFVEFACRNFRSRRRIRRSIVFVLTLELFRPILLVTCLVNSALIPLLTDIFVYIYFVDKQQTS